MSKEFWRKKLQQRLWETINEVDSEMEDKATVKLSNQDVTEILTSIITSLEPIEFKRKTKQK